MAFQSNVQAPDLVGLALNLMQMKRDRELQERKLALEEFRAKNEAEATKAKTMFEMVKLGREVAGQEAKAGADLAPSLSVAADDNAPMADRAAAARSYLPALMQEAQFRAGPDAPVTADILNQIGNEAAGAGAISRATAKPELDWEYDEAGNKRRVIVGAGGKMTPVPGAVWVPPKAGVTVNVGANGQLDLGKIADVSRAEKANFNEAIAPYEALDNAISTLQSFQSMADENGNLPFEANQFVSSDVMAALRGEALNEGDVKRLTNVGLMNTAKEWVGLPAQMNVKQTNTLGKILSEKARKKEGKRRQLIDDYIYRSEEFKFNPRLIVGKYAKDYGKGASDQGAVGTADDGQIQPMTEADKRRIEKKISKATGLGPRDITAGMVLDAWRAEHGIQSERGQ